MIRVKDAIESILNNVKPVSSISIYINEALDRISYEDVFAKDNSPAFNRSAMDGYALVFGDVDMYRIVEHEYELKKGCALRINTGMPIPKNVDSVIEIEKTKENNGLLKILADEVRKENNFNKIGSEFKVGDILVKRGERINPRLWALLAYTGIVRLAVYKKPVVGIITTGDEVIFPGDVLKNNIVYNSNYFLLYGLLKKWGADVVYFGHVGDSKDEMKNIFSYAIDRCDVFLSTGSSSMGSSDFAHEVLENLGVQILFDKTTIKPGKPAIFGKLNDKITASLPGWPSALCTTSYIYVKPLIYKLCGRADYRNQMSECIVTEFFHSKKGKCYFDRVNIDKKGANIYCNSTGSQKTDNYYTIARADGLISIKEDLGGVEKNTPLPLLLFED